MILFKEYFLLVNVVLLMRQKMFGEVLCKKFKRSKDKNEGLFSVKFVDLLSKEE